MQPIPPGPRPLPLLGHIPWLVRNPLLFITHLGRTYGDMCTFRIGPKQFYLVNHPDLIKQVMLSQTFVRTPLTRRLLASFLGEGLFSQEGDTHRRQRRLMQPAFHRERMAAYGQIVLDATYQMLDQWRPDETRDLVADMMRLTFTIVSRALFSTDTSAETQAVGQSFKQVQISLDRQYELYAAMPGWVPLIQDRSMRAAVATLQRVTRQIVQHRRRAGRGDRGDLLSMLLLAQDEDGSTMSDEQVCAQVLSLLFAGHETTANTLCWTWHLLGRHPQVVARLAAEVQEVAGERPVRPDDLPHLSYTEQVIREALRLYPPAWWAERTPLEDVTLGGYRVPARTPVVISVYVTHRDPRFFPRPDHFDPDRFAPGQVEGIPRYGYLPFGAGSHICIGNGFALMEARLLLAAMVQRFALEALPGSPVAPRPAITMGLAGGLPVRLHARAEVVAPPVVMQM
jgi:cytochrome P450